jgi:quercetin dioxygenase-like cupin family protein
MTTPQDIFENPATGERVRWHLRAADTGGELVRAEFWVRPGGGSTRKPHRADARVEVLSGRLILSGQQVVLAGEHARLPAGTSHSWRNGGGEELHFVLEIDEPDDFEGTLEASFARARARRGRRARLAALAAVACFAVAAPTAMADSIVYVKDGNVWAASPDGSRQVQITKTGGYHEVSQADDGTMVALAGDEHLHKLSRSGQVLADIPTYVSDGSPVAGPVNQFHGPFDPQISPDGSLVAFEWRNENYTNGGTPDCNPQSVPPCYDFTSHQGVGITHSDRFTGYEEYGLLTGWIYPSWTSRGQLLRSDPGAILNVDTVFDPVAPGMGDGDPKPWFWDSKQGIGVTDVELSRDEKTVVGVAGFTDQLLRVYRPLFDPYNAPAQDLTPWGTNTPVVEHCAELSNPAGGRFSSPTLSPDGHGLAFATADGIHSMALPDLSGGCQPAGGEHLLIAGASSPDWGPADVPSATPAPAPTSQLTVAVKRSKLRSALRNGLVVTVRGATGKVTAAALKGRTKVGTGRAAARNGTAKVRVRFTKPARRSLARKRSVRLTIRITAGATRSVNVTLRRA